MRTAVIETVCDVAATNPDLWLLTGDLGYSVLEQFMSRFPDRYVNVGVAEQNLMGIAAGLALSGKQVVAYSIANFATFRCLEQIRNDIVHHRADVKIIAVGAGYAYGSQGHTHYGLSDMAVMHALGGIDVITPADPVEARLAAHVMFERPGPAYMRVGRAGEPTIHEGMPVVDRGRRIVCREGDSALIIASGSILGEALIAAKELEGAGVHCAVWSMPWVMPLDHEAVAEAAKQYPLIITVEEGTPQGGLASAIATSLSVLEPPHARQLIAAVGDKNFPASISQIAARVAHSIDGAGLATRIRDALGNAGNIIYGDAMDHSAGSRCREQ